MSEDKFDVEAVTTADEPSSVTLNFENKDGALRSVTLPRSRIPPLLSLLQTKIEAGSVTPINPGSLFAGQSFALEAYQVFRNPDGSARLLFFVRLPDQQDRGVTMPVDLTAVEVAELVNLLKQ